MISMSIALIERQIFVFVLRLALSSTHTLSSSRTNNDDDDVLMRKKRASRRDNENQTNFKRFSLQSRNVCYSKLFHCLIFDAWLTRLLFAVLCRVVVVHHLAATTE